MHASRGLLTPRRLVLSPSFLSSLAAVLPISTVVACGGSPLSLDCVLALRGVRTTLIPTLLLGWPFLDVRREGGGSSWNNRKFLVAQGDGLFKHMDLGNFG